MTAQSDPVLADPRLALGALRWAELRRITHERTRLVGLLRGVRPAAWAGMLAGGAITVAMSTVTAYAVGWLVGATARAHRLSDVVSPVILLAALGLIGQCAATASEVSGALAAREVDGEVRASVRQIALSPDGISHLDDQRFRDDIERACDLGLGWHNRSPGNAAVGQLALIFRVVGGVAAAVVLGLHLPVPAAAILIGSLLVRAAIRRQWVWLAEVDVVRPDENRRARYLSSLACEADAAKDVRLFGLSGWIVARMRAAEIRARTPGWAARTRLLQHQQGMSIAVVLATSALALWAVGVSGESASVAARCLTAAFLVMQLAVVGPEIFEIDYGIVTLRALDRVVARYAPRKDSRPSAAVGAQAPTVRFEDVHFSYPGAETPVLSGLNLEVRPGEVLAVVGVNGAGKTTLVKLMAGLYQPTSGRIIVDGVPLDGVDPGSWRRRMTVLFQDFVRYGTTVHDNIALSAPEHLDDEAGVAAAVSAAGARQMIEGLPGGTATTLWKGDTAGRDLSGGQWQRLAIARALFAVAHGRRLLVLDEPTAHLDVEAEHEFNDRIMRNTGGVSLVLISHRLSNVRAADRIAVLDAGVLAECDSHDELMRANGIYARLFRLQASRFSGVGQ